MLKFIGKALAGMVLTKEAREAAGGLAKSAVRTATQKIQTGAPDAHGQALAEIPPSPQQAAANSRAELIRQAMAVRAAKQTVLAELNEEDRAKLVATAMRAFLAESKSEG